MNFDIIRFLHDARNPYEVVHDTVEFSGKIYFWKKKNIENMGQKYVFFETIELFGH